MNSIFGRNTTLNDDEINLKPSCPDNSIAFNNHFMQISSNLEDRHTVEYSQYLKHPPIFSMYLSPAHKEEIEG